MSTRTALILSLGLNVALAAAAYRLARKQPASAPETLAIKAITNRAPESAETAPTHSPPPGTSARFHWSMIESRDYPAYIANLRAIGCPEPTIRDIIYADVSELFVRKRQASLESMERQFWDLMATDESQHGNDEWQMTYDTLKEEKAKLLKDLLGDTRDQTAQKRRRPDPQAQLGFLSEEKQDQVAQIFEKYSQLRRDMQPQPGQSIGPDGRERFKVLMQQQEADLKQLLTPEEYDEYKLRRSSAVHTVQNLYGFAPTEEEARAITRLQMEFEEGPRKPDPAGVLDKRTLLAARQQARISLVNLNAPRIRASRKFIVWPGATICHKQWPCWFTKSGMRPSSRPVVCARTPRLMRISVRLRWKPSSRKPSAPSRSISA